MDEYIEKRVWNYAYLNRGLSLIYNDKRYYSKNGLLDLLQNNMEAGDTGIFLCTAAPAKFKESVDEILGIDLPLPEALASRADLKILSDNMDADFAVLRKYLLKK